MPRSVLIDCWLEGTTGGEEFDVAVFPVSDDFQPQILRVAPGSTIEADFDIAEVHFLPINGGYWGMSFVPPPEVIKSPIPRLPQGPIGWWHQAHGIATSDVTVGEGIRIGIIDEALGSGPNHLHLDHIKNLGGQAWNSNDTRAFTPKSGHSLAICGIVSSRATAGPHFLGVAPGAEVLFAAAGEDGSERLDVARLANAIDMLADEYCCDIICFSAGDCESELPSIEVAVNEAYKRGCLCFVAAGNEGDGPRYPARYANCLAVGAVGKVGFAPPHTFEQLQQLTSTSEPVDGLYLWHHSARGTGVNFVGAGVAIMAPQDSGIYSVSGTSYAAPIAAAAAAVVLSRDRTYLSLGRGKARAECAIEAIRCSSVRIYPEECECGVIMAELSYAG